jgi:hypothetical protein
MHHPRRRRVAAHRPAAAVSRGRSRNPAARRAFLEPLAPLSLPPVLAYLLSPTQSRSSIAPAAARRLEFARLQLRAKAMVAEQESSSRLAMPLPSWRTDAGSLPPPRVACLPSTPKERMDAAKNLRTFNSQARAATRYRRTAPISLLKYFTVCLAVAGELAERHDEHNCPEPEVRRAREHPGAGTATKIGRQQHRWVLARVRRCCRVLTRSPPVQERWLERTMEASGVHPYGTPLFSQLPNAVLHTPAAAPPPLRAESSRRVLSPDTSSPSRNVGALGRARACAAKRSVVPRQQGSDPAWQVTSRYARPPTMHLCDTAGNAPSSGRPQFARRHPLARRRRRRLRHCAPCTRAAPSARDSAAGRLGRQTLQHRPPPQRRSGRSSLASVQRPPRRRSPMMDRRHPRRCSRGWRARSGWLPRCSSG